MAENEDRAVMAISEGVGGFVDEFILFATLVFVSAVGLPFLEVYASLNARSQALSSARPCAMLARRVTVHGVDASRSLSSVFSWSGCLWAVRT